MTLNMMNYLSLPICSEALSKGSGLVRDLSMSPKDIESLELQGYIKNAMSNHGDTWKLTKKGKQTRDFLLNKRSCKMKLADWFCRYILRLNV